MKYTGRLPDEYRKQPNPKHMFNSTILAIIITLVFIYLITSIIVTGVNEAWFILTSQRSKKLKEFMESFIFDDEWRKTTFTEFSKSPFIDILRKDENHFPDAIPPANFAKAILTIAGEGKSDLKSVKENVKEHSGTGSIYPLLRSLLSQVETTAELQKELEELFDTAMERVTGWYRKYAKILSFIIALLIAGALNIDSVNIASRLWADKDLAERNADFVTSVLPQFSKNDKGEIVITSPASGKTVILKDTANKAKEIKAIADSLKPVAESIRNAGQMMKDSGIPMGWSQPNYPVCTKGSCCLFGRWLIKILGILITAVAVSLGAPFWFDVLTRVTPLRKSTAETAVPDKTKSTAKS